MTDSPLVLFCPRCKAKPGQKCTGRRGNQLPWQHEGRKSSGRPAATALDSGRPVKTKAPYTPKDPPIRSTASKPKTTSDKPITWQELYGAGIWHAKRGAQYLATIYEVRSKGVFIPVEDGYAREPLPTLELAKDHITKILEEN
jgi:hypothetical protein